MGLLLHSGLGAKAQQIGQQLISAYQNQSYLGPTPFYQFAMEQGIFNDSDPLILRHHYYFTIAEGTQVPIGRMELEAQKTATAAGEQLQRDVNQLRAYNDSLRELNDRVVPVLKDVSGSRPGYESTRMAKVVFRFLIGYQCSIRPTLGAADRCRGGSSRLSASAHPDRTFCRADRHTKSELLRCRHPGPDAHREADRRSHAGRPCADPEHEDWCTGLQTNPCHPITTRPARPSRSR